MKAFANIYFHRLIATKEFSLCTYTERTHRLSRSMLRQPSRNIRIDNFYTHIKSIWRAKVEIDCAVILHRSSKNNKSEQISNLSTLVVD